uniref:LisH domain-containing protein n=1 Tax=Globodera pallida TaxID=36090 RepID=A0A183C4K5_GLOPA
MGRDLDSRDQKSQNFESPDPGLASCQAQYLRQHQPVVLTELQKNTVRVVGQYLRELGMMETVDSLVEESGCRIENPLSQKLRDCVEKSEWQKALGIVEKLRGQLTKRQYTTVRVLLLEERFKELIRGGEFLLALRLLQLDFPKCKELLLRHEHWATVLCSRGISGKTCPASVGHTPKGPATCADAAAEQTAGAAEAILAVSGEFDCFFVFLNFYPKTKQCDLHVLAREQNVLDERAILVDHQPFIYTIPKFGASNFLPVAITWLPGPRATSPTQVHIHQNILILQEVVGISSLSWSKDSRYLAVTSTEQANGVGCFIYFVPSGRFIKEYAHYTGDAFTTVAFFQDDLHKLACAGERGHFHVYDIDRPEDNAKTFEGFRIRCLYACMDGKTVLAADTHNRIRAYDFESAQEQTIIQEASQIITFCVDREEKFCLVTTKTEGIRLWCLRTNALIRSFFGSSHCEFVITSSFGGPDESFIASGSEDCSVVIWNLRRSHPVKRLIGHTSTVNSVSWNPVDSSMLASASDDGTIKIWSRGTTSF